MMNLWHYIRVFLIGACVAFAWANQNKAHADYYFAQTFPGWANCSGQSGCWHEQQYGTYSAVGDAFVAWFSAHNPGSAPWACAPFVGSPYWNMNCTNVDGPVNYVLAAYHCNGDGGTYGTANYTTCTTYVAPPTCTAGTDVSTGWYDWGTDPYSTSKRLTCSSGCQAQFEGSFVAGRQQVGGVYHYFADGSYSLTGDTCTGTDIPTADTGMPPPTCGAGQSLGTVNGSYLCVDVGTGTPVDPNSGSTATQSTNTTATTTNGDGSTTTTNTTVNTDGSTTTTTTTTAADGSSSSSSTTTSGDPLKGYCQQFPDAPVCKPSNGSFGGSCGAWTCDGDAAECASAKAVSELNCKLESDATLNGDKLLTDTGLSTAESTFNSNKTSTDISSLLQLDQRTLSPASCPGPYTVHTSLFGDLSFDVSYICQVGQIVGTFLFIGALLLAVRIVAGGVL